MMKTILKCSLVSTAIGLATAHAAVSIQILEIGDDVVMSSDEGSLDTSQWQLLGGGQPAQGEIADTLGIVTGGNGFVDIHAPGANAAVFGPEPNLSAVAYVSDFGSGPNLGTGFFEGFGRVFLTPASYGSGTSISASTATFTNATLSSLGLTQGQYVWSWSGAGAERDHIQLTVGESTPINFTETTDLPRGGDNEVDSTVPFLGDLQIGLNLFSGSLFQANKDAFEVMLPSGLRIESVDLVVSNHIDSDVDSTDVVGEYTLPGGELGSSFLTDDGTVAVITTPSTEEGSYRFRAGHNGLIPGSSSDWQWEINVSAIPEPSSSALILATVGILLLTERRRTN